MVSEDLLLSDENSDCGMPLSNRTYSITERSVIILDWDDTVLPTSNISLVYRKFEKLSEQYCFQLKKIEKAAYCMLAAAIELGTVIIITNADDGWVEESCKMFLPSLLPFLQEVSIVSSRSRYYAISSNDETAWKINTFRDELMVIRRKFPTEELSIMSIGDSIHEREALISFSKYDANIIPKSVKLMESPLIPQLLSEQLLITNSLRDMVFNRSSMDLKLSMFVPSSKV